MTESLLFSADVQQFEKSVLGRQSRSQTTAKEAVAEEDDFEKDKGSDSEEEDKADGPPRRRPVSLVFSCIHLCYDSRNPSRPMQERVSWLFCKTNPMKNDGIY